MADRQPFGRNDRVQILLQAFLRRVTLIGQAHLVPVRSTCELDHDLELLARVSERSLGQSHGLLDERNQVPLG